MSECFSPNSPALVANLWDTTDRELDNVSESVFTRLGLMGGDLSAQSADSNSNSNSKPVSLVSAVAQARNDCKLPFLTGAACVVYGIPVYWT